MTAAERLDALDTLDAFTLCDRAEAALGQLVDVMNRETMLLRAGRMVEAATLSGQKTQLSQDYVAIARAVQRAAPRLKAEAPERMDGLRRGHESLATQMAENLRVLATARAVTQDLLTDVARGAARATAPKTYGAGGGLDTSKARPLSGLSLNRAL